MIRAAVAALLLALIGTARAASPPAVEAEHGMVVSSERRASEVGVQILEAGGNAIDAAVAVGYALAVLDPCCGNIGGGGFMVIHLADGRDSFINFREKAPAAATAGMYLDSAGNPVAALSRHGWRAAGVPGTVMGFDRALGEYGKLPRAALLAPAIALARDGYVLSRANTDILEPKTGLFRADPEAAKIFLRPDGSAMRPGDRLVQRNLAATLEAIAEDGPDAFYKGPVAAAVETASRAGGGILTRRDFAGYTVTEGPPLSCAYRGYVLLSAPPPSSGGATMCEILNVLGGYDLRALGFRSAKSVRLMVEAMRHAYRDRNAELGDPAFVANPLDRLLSADHAASIRAAIDAGKTMPGRARRIAGESRDDALFGRRQGRQRGRRHLHDQRLFRRRRDRARHRLFSQQRDGRFHGKARRAKPVTAWSRAPPTRSRPASGRFPRWRRPSSKRTERCFWCSAAPAARASSRSCSKPS